MTRTGLSSFLQVYVLPEVVGVWSAAPQIESVHQSGRDGEETARVVETGFKL